MLIPNGININLLNGLSSIKLSDVITLPDFHTQQMIWQADASNLQLYKTVRTENTYKRILNQRRFQ